MNERVHKYIAWSGLCSRRAAERMVAEGRVTINGERAEAGAIVREGDAVLADGSPVTKGDAFVYIMLNKPTGVVSTAKEQFGRPCVADLVDAPARVYPVGRLDWDTSGLLLLTNDGDLTFKLTHPKHNIDKTYIARVAALPGEEGLADFRAGLVIDGRKTAPARITAIGGLELRVVIREGRNRQVRKMLEAIGCPALELRRVATGRLGLGGLAVGKWRYLTEDEVMYLKNI